MIYHINGEFEKQFHKELSNKQFSLHVVLHAIAVEIMKKNYDAFFNAHPEFQHKQKEFMEDHSSINGDKNDIFDCKDFNDIVDNTLSLLKSLENMQTCKQFND